MVQLSHLYITTRKTIALTRWIFVGKMMSLLFNTLSRIVIAFLPRSKRLLVSWLQSPSTVILEPRTIKSVTASTFPISPFPTSLLSYGAACCMFPGEGNGTPLQYSCLENPRDGGAWWAAVHGVAKSRIQLSNFTFTFHFHALEKEMATHSSVLAWRIPGTGEPGGPPSMGPHRVGHD